MRVVAWGMLAGCIALSCGGPAVTSTRIHGPDGKDNWVAIECKDAQLACVAEAGRVCPDGYDVADEMGHAGQESRGYASAGLVGGFAAERSHSTYAGEMLVRCKGQPVAALGHACFDDGDCNAGDRCLFAPDAGFSDKGRCAQQ